MDSVTMIMHGTGAKLGEWPWSTALYHIVSNSTWEFYCGGTLISENAVITGIIDRLILYFISFA